MKARSKERVLEYLGLQCPANVVEGPFRSHRVNAYMLRCGLPRWHRMPHSQTGIFYQDGSEGRNGGTWWETE